MGLLITPDLNIQYQHRNVILTVLLMNVYLSFQRSDSMIPCKYNVLQKSEVNTEILLLHKIYLFDH